MKITIDYNGAFAVCNIEPMEEPGKMVNFNEADTKSQTFALSAFRCIEEHWKREKSLERYKKHPVMHIKREFQVTQQNFDQLHELSRKGIILTWSFDTTASPNISLLLNDNHTTVTTNGWLLEDMEGRWWGMDNGYHRMLVEYQKIVIER
jgi:hypothetical protein